jgi:hypothetical protein
MNFHLCFVRSPKKITKYFKINKIRNKVIIDIKKILEEEKIDISNKDSLAFFKVLVWNKIKSAKEKERDVYYIPNFSSNDVDVKKLIMFKKMICDMNDEFNLLCFHHEFIGTNWLVDLLNNIEVFDNTQILEDY